MSALVHRWSTRGKGKLWPRQAHSCAGLRAWSGARHRAQIPLADVAGRTCGPDAATTRVRHTTGPHLMAIIHHTTPTARARTPSSPGVPAGAAAAAACTTRPCWSRRPSWRPRSSAAGSATATAAALASPYSAPRSSCRWGSLEASCSSSSCASARLGRALEGEAGWGVACGAGRGEETSTLWLLAWPAVPRRVFLVSVVFNVIRAVASSAGKSNKKDGDDGWGDL